MSPVIDIKLAKREDEQNPSTPKHAHCQAALSSAVQAAVCAQPKSILSHRSRKDSRDTCMHACQCCYCYGTKYDSKGSCTIHAWLPTTCYALCDMLLQVGRASGCIATPAWTTRLFPAYVHFLHMQFLHSSPGAKVFACLDGSKKIWLEESSLRSERMTLFSCTARLMALGRPTARGPTSLASRLASLSKFLAMYSAAGCSCSSLNSLASGSALSSICIQAKMCYQAFCSRDWEAAWHTADAC